MSKVYYDQKHLSNNFTKFFKSFSSLSKPILFNLSFIIIGMLSAESVVTADFSKKLKDHFSFILLESAERRFRRFFDSFSSFAYSFYSSFISFIISSYHVKHHDFNIHFSFDHMFVKDRFTILLFSLRIGKQGFPVWFRCFKGKHNPDAYSIDLIKQGILFCRNLFTDPKYHIIFLADRWFPNISILSYIQDIGCFFCIRVKSFFSFTYTNSRGASVTSHLRDIKPLKYSSKVFPNVLFTRHSFKTNIVISASSNTDDPWYIVTNDSTSRAVRNYSHRFGSIESIFKSQKSNGFRLESTNTQKIEHFISLFTVMSIALVWLTIIGVDYCKNKHTYHLRIRDVRKHSDNTRTRIYSYFNLGLTIFNLCYYNFVDFRLKFNFILYDI